MSWPTFIKRTFASSGTPALRKLQAVLIAILMGACRISAEEDPVPLWNAIDLLRDCSLEIQPAYSNNGANWNDYVLQDGTHKFNASDQACPAGSDYCLHAGELRQLTGNLPTSCENLSITDSLDAFHWTCLEAGDAIQIASTGLKENRRLYDLIDSTSLTWKENAVQIQGNGYADCSKADRWWSNPIQLQNSGLAGAAGVASTIYLVTQSNLNHYALTNHKMALVLGPDVVVEFARTATLKEVAYSSGDFNWLEGSFIAPAPMNNYGIHLDNNSHNVLRHIKLINQGSSLSIDGIRLSTSTYNRLEHIQVFNFTWGLTLNVSSNKNRVHRLTTGNNEGDGLRLLGNSNDNVFTQILSSAADLNGIRLDSSEYNFFNGVTTALNGESGIKLLNGSHNNYFGHLSTLNNTSYGVDLDGSNANTLFYLHTSSNGLAAINLNNASNHVFQERLGVDLATCTISGGTNPGLDASCQATDASTSGTPVTINLSASFAGPLTSDDSSSPDDTNGQADFNSNYSWASLENTFRSWSKSGSGLLDTAARGQCSTGTCQIWDWRLQSSDASNLNGNHPAPANLTSQTFTHSNTNITAYLQFSFELSSRSAGNNNGLCEPGESCLYLPNDAAWQGQALLAPGESPAGAFAGTKLYVALSATE